jgi:hypothetical protein
MSCGKIKQYISNMNFSINSQCLATACIAGNVCIAKAMTTILVSLFFVFERALKWYKA